MYIFNQPKEKKLKESVSSFRGKNMHQIILKWIKEDEKWSLIATLEKGGIHEGWNDVEEYLLKKKVPVDAARAFIIYSLVKLGLM